MVVRANLGEQGAALGRSRPSDRPSATPRALIGRSTDVWALRSAIRRIEPIWFFISALPRWPSTLYVVSGPPLRAIHAPEIAWWILALMVLMCERWPVELEFRRIVALLLADRRAADAGADLRLRHATRSSRSSSARSSRSLLRRLPADQVRFNLAQFALVSAVLLIVVHVAAEARPRLRLADLGRGAASPRSSAAC